MSGVDAAGMAQAFGVKSKLRSIVLDHLLNADLKEQVERPGQPALGVPDLGQVGRTQRSQLHTNRPGGPSSAAICDKSDRSLPRQPP